MLFLYSLFVISSFVLFIIPHCQGNCEVNDADLCLDEQRYGPDKICYFAHMKDYEDPSIIDMQSCGDATKYYEGVFT